MSNHDPSFDMYAAFEALDTIVNHYKYSESSISKDITKYKIHSKMSGNDIIAERWLSAFYFEIEDEKMRTDESMRLLVEACQTLYSVVHLLSLGNAKLNIEPLLYQITTQLQELKTKYNK